MLKAVIILISKAMEEQFTGSLQLNFFKGKITNVNKIESFKLDEIFEVK